MISGVAFHGNEHQVLLLAQKGKACLWISTDVIVESSRVLARKFPEKHSLLDEFLESTQIRVIPREMYAAVVEEQGVRDPDDRHVLAAALRARCDYLVTGDEDLLVLGRYRGIEITKARELLARLR